MGTMIQKISIIFLLICITCLHGASSREERKNNTMMISEWCNTTPHPHPCNRFMARLAPKSDQEFRDMSIAAAIERAKTLARKLSSVASSTMSMSENMVYKDCNRLLDNTIHHLTASLDKDESADHLDVQTWLSAALTNVQTCMSGWSHELGLNSSSSMMMMLMRDVLDMITNSLAAHAALMGLGNSTITADDDSDRGVVPEYWVSEVDRKLLQNYVVASRANVIVSQDGSGQFSSIQEAIEYATGNRAPKKRVIVYVKKGVYQENILINRTMDKVTLVGDGVTNTIITANRSSADGFTTYSTATFGVDGNGFIARGITFRNTAGPESGQAVALRSASDLSVFYGCSFEGYQDTLFTQAQRQLYKSCYIYGTVDIIFGNAAVVIQNCVIYVRKPMVGQANMITAQGRGDPYQNTGISIHNSRILAAPDLKPVLDSFKTYLGRPWQEYSRTVIMKTYLDTLVEPEGWSNWGDSDFALTTLYYGEYQNFGPGAPTDNRVNWTGYHNITGSGEAAQFTVANLILGPQWLPATGVPFIAGL